MIKVILESKEIDFFIINEETGKITDTGENSINRDTFEETYIDLKTLLIGKVPKISYNYSEYSKKGSKKDPVWVDLLYKIKSIQNKN